MHVETQLNLKNYLLLYKRRIRYQDMERAEEYLCLVTLSEVCMCDTVI